MFLFVEESKRQIMKALTDLDMLGAAVEDIQMHLLIENAKVFDMLHEKFGVEEEECVLDAQEHDLTSDPDIDKVMQENIDNIPPEIVALVAKGLKKY